MAIKKQKFALKRRWTEKEASVIIREVTKNPYSIQTAFSNASLKLKGRTKDSIAMYYYTHLAKFVRITITVEIVKSKPRLKNNRS